MVVREQSNQVEGLYLLTLYNTGTWGPMILKNIHWMTERVQFVHLKNIGWVGEEAENKQQISK